MFSSSAYSVFQASDQREVNGLIPLAPYASSRSSFDTWESTTLISRNSPTISSLSPPLSEIAGDIAHFPNNSRKPERYSPHRAPAENVVVISSGQSLSIPLGIQDPNSSLNASNVRQERHRPSLTNNNHCLGDALAIPCLSKEIRGATSISTAIAVAESMSTDRGVDAFTRPIIEWLEKQPCSEITHLKGRVRMEIMELAKEMWNKAPAKCFLSFEEYDVFVDKHLLTSDFMDNSQEEKLIRTIQSLALVNKLCGLYRHRVLTAADIALVCELLVTRMEEDGFMRALYALLSRSRMSRLPKNLRSHLQKIQQVLERKRDDQHDSYRVQEIAQFIDAVMGSIKECTLGRAM